jgi:hypothetical protein
MKVQIEKWTINEEFPGQVKTNYPYDSANERWIADCNPEHAHLIAAAPDLLEACKEALDVLRYAQEQMDGPFDMPWPVTQRLEAAISRAEGKD